MFGLKGGEVRLVNRRRSKVCCFFSRFSFLSFSLPLHSAASFCYCIVSDCSP